MMMTTMTTIDLRYLECPMKNSCEDFHKKWTDWCFARQGQDLALCPVVPDYYTQVLNDKARNMIRKSHRHFEYFTFNHNSYLVDMFEINTSKSVRQGQRMTSSYLERPKPIVIGNTLCHTVHDEWWLGAFDIKTHKLRAYSHLVLVGDLAIINRIIGHGDYLTFGVMNGLIHSMVTRLLKDTKVKWVNYLDLINCSDGLKHFKKSVGFSTHKVTFEH